MKSIRLASLFILSLVVASFYSCENEPLDPDFNIDFDETIDESPNDDGSGPPGGESTGDYWPMSVNNAWVYDYTIDNVAQDDYLMEIEANVDYQGNSVYRYSQFLPTATATDGTGFENLSIETYSRKNGGDYIMAVGDLVAEIEGVFTLSQTGYSVILLKDYLEVGATWSSSAQTVTSLTSQDPDIPSIPDIVMNLEYEFEIVDKGISLEVNGFTYTDVIRVGYVLNSFSPDFPTQVISVETEYYFALNVGLIKMVSVSNDQADGIESVTSTEIKDYTLN